MFVFKNRKKFWGIVIFCVVILITIIFYIKSEPKRLNRLMDKLVSEYYEEKIMGKVIGIDKQIITLEYLSQAGYNLKRLEKCDSDSFSYVIIENPQETNTNKIKYKIENHLKCK